jgi:hypothetical protein
VALDKITTHYGRRGRPEWDDLGLVCMKARVRGSSYPRAGPAVSVSPFLTGRPGRPTTQGREIMTAISRPERGNSKAHNTKTASLRAYEGDVGSQYAPPYPAIATARRVAALASRLPGASQDTAAKIRHADAVALAAGFSEQSLAAILWRSVPWLSVFVAVGRAWGMTASQVERMRPDELADLLAELVASQEESAVKSGRKSGVGKTA